MTSLWSGQGYDPESLVQAGEFEQSPWLSVSWMVVADSLISFIVEVSSSTSSPTLSLHPLLAKRFGFSCLVASFLASHDSGCGMEEVEDIVVAAV